MSKNAAIGGIWTSLVSPGIYKRTQGKRVRQTTAGLIVTWAVFGCYTLYAGPLLESDRAVRLGVPVVLAVVTSWLAYRMVNIPQFADFLIAVEAEMKKISWPDARRCFRAAAVVIAVMFLLAAALFLFDQIWMWFFRAIGILKL